MKRFLKRLGQVLGVVVVLVVGFVITIAVMSSSRASKHYDVNPAAVAVPTGQEALTEGLRLYTARGCAECHGQHGDGRVLIDSPLGFIAPSNLANAIRDYDDVDWVRTIRHGVMPDGRPLIFMPSHEYYPLSDSDLGHIIAHIKTLTPSGEAQPPSEIGPIGKMLHVFGAMPMVPAELIDHDGERPVAPEVADTVEFGAYLAIGCTGCHGETFAGGPIPGAPVEQLGIPPNLTPHATGLEGWTREQFVAALRTGRRPDGTELDPTKMPYPVFGAMTDTELHALYRFLQQLPAMEFGLR